MTAADRLRKAVEAALPCVQRCRTSQWGHVYECPADYAPAVLAAVQPIVEELERDRERLRAKLQRAMHYLQAAGIVVAMKGERDGE